METIQIVVSSFLLGGSFTLFFISIRSLQKKVREIYKNPNKYLTQR